MILDPQNMDLRYTIEVNCVSIKKRLKTKKRVGIWVLEKIVKYFCRLYTYVSLLKKSYSFSIRLCSLCIFLSLPSQLNEMIIDIAYINELWIIDS
jgi:hypothetical protein